MSPPPSGRFVVAELNTHQYMFRGVGVDRAGARAALLHAWTEHRNALLAHQPQLASSLPEAADMERHFRMSYLEFELGAGYRDGERISALG